jgi:hypothetical protein
MAPEQAAGQADHIGPTTDVYALGTIFYECLTGQVPFVSASAVETMEKIRADEPRPPRRLQPSVPRDLETICLNCLHKEARRRYASAHDLAEDLRRFLHGEPIRARSTSAGERLWKWCRRRPTRSALKAVGLLLVLTSFVLAGFRTYRENQRLAQLRDEVDRLVKEGQESLVRHEEDIAQERFREAWIKVQAEPALQNYQTSVAGWLDHSRRAADKQRWKQRSPPREYDELRDEALVLSLLLRSSPRRARFRGGVEIATLGPRITHRSLPGPDLGGWPQLSIGDAVEFRPREGRPIRTTGTVILSTDDASRIIDSEGKPI